MLPSTWPATALASTISSRGASGEACAQALAPHSRTEQEGMARDIRRLIQEYRVELEVLGDEAERAGSGQR
jgi:hypothetical protein